MALQQSTLSVLLVEDNPGDARLVEHHLDSAVTDQYVDDVSLRHVETLTAGLDALGSDTFDVVLLDLGLPDSTGLETLASVTTSSIPVPIIVLTGFDDRERAVEAISRGAQDYLSKNDLDSDRLIRSLRYAIERFEQERALKRQTEQMAFFNQILRHDMLNGMNVILARGELLADTLDGESGEHAGTVVDWSEDIIDLTRKIRSILNTLTGDSQPELRSIDLEPIATAAAERARSMGADVRIDVPGDLAVRADDLLEDVLANLTTNAVEHGATTPEPGEADETDVAIAVTAESAGNRVRIRVADDGPGVPETARERIFDRGQKGSGSSGSGFGLYFVASMIEAYGGAVATEESDMGGAAFVLDLPAARRFDDS